MSGRARKRQRTGELARRSSREWVVRGAVALALLVCGYFGTVSSLANAIVRVDSARAYTLDSDNGVVLARYAEDAFARQPTKEAISRPAILAREALLADPTAAEALTVLGFQAQLRGEEERADALFSYSTALSRRELRPRIWAIEEAVGRGDIASALRNYDIALRTSNDAANMLMPTLAAALSEPRIRAGLLPILGERPNWRESFLNHAAGSGIEPDGALALVTEGRRMGLRLDEDQTAKLINALLAKDRVDAAWRLYRSVRPDARRDRSRDPQFALQAGTRALFDWRTDGDSGLGAAIVAQGEAGLLDFAVPPSTSGGLVSQMQILPPGQYVLTGRSRGLSQPDASKPYWVLTCQDGRELGRVIVPDSDQNGGRFTGRFTVPQGCSRQTLTLMARASEDIMGVTGQIERVQLVPAENESGVRS